MKGVLVGAAALLLVVAPAASAASPTITAHVAPASPRFGDSFSYVVRATVGSSELGSARVVARLGPFTRVGLPVEKRSSVNGVGTITVTEFLVCLSATCLVRPAGTAVALPRARVSAHADVAVAPLVEVAVGSRVGTAAMQADEPAFRRQETLPGSTFRVPPTGAAVLLSLLGLVLLLVGAVLLTAPLRRARSEKRREIDVDQRGRAVRLLRESATRHGDDRRRAASLASRIAAEPELARSAAGVAWSRPVPGPPDAMTLADRLEHATSGEA